jgi:hypothetical protein
LLDHRLKLRPLLNLRDRRALRIGTAEPEQRLLLT